MDEAESCFVDGHEHQFRVILVRGLFHFEESGAKCWQFECLLQKLSLCIISIQFGVLVKTLLNLLYPIFIFLALDDVKWENFIQYLR